MKKKKATLEFQISWHDEDVVHFAFFCEGILLKIYLQSVISIQVCFIIKFLIVKMSSNCDFNT